MDYCGEKSEAVLESGDSDRDMQTRRMGANLSCILRNTHDKV